MYGVYFRICKNISIHTHTHICVYIYTCIWGFPGCSDGKESAWNAGDLDSIPGLGWSPGKEKGYPPTPVFLPRESSVDRGAWRDMVHGIAESDTTEQLKHTHIYTYVCIYLYVWMYICICVFLLSCIWWQQKKSQVWNEHSKNWNISDSRFHFVIQLLLKNFCLKKF